MCELVHILGEISGEGKIGSQICAHPWHTMGHYRCLTDRSVLAGTDPVYLVWIELSVNLPRLCVTMGLCPILATGQHCESSDTRSTTRRLRHLISCRKGRLC
jgi:hypothetical protein